MADSTPKLKILAGAAADLSAATYQIADESHTIGNALRWMLMKKWNFADIGIYQWSSHCLFHYLDEVKSFNTSQMTQLNDLFRAFSVPHPSENVINVRIQMYDKLSSLDALIDALDNLDKLVETIEDAYIENLKENNHEVWDEKS